MRPQPSAAPGASGDTLSGGRYELVRPLGVGGMARVWEVRDRTTDQRLALKRLTGRFDRRNLALFEREYYTLTSLHHPNIVHVHDYASDAQGPFYTMELLSGSDVSSLAPRPWQSACRILRDVALGLALIHARRYVHRDISARNVWMTEDARVKLIDFGTLVPFGRAGDVAGTPPFIAPEALHGSELDQRTDLYSLGALGYWLLTGLHAFPARALHVLEEAWKTRPRAPSRRVAELKRKDLPDVPPALDALLESLLSFDSRERPNSAAEVIDALSALAGAPAEPQPLVLESYLKTPVLVGREHTMTLLSEALAKARAGHGASVLIESTAGMGRSRIVFEVAVKARLASAVVLRAEAAGAHATIGAAESFARKLLDALPDAAHQASRPYASVLGHLSDELRQRLGIAKTDLAQLPSAHGESRMRIQAALCDWFLALATEYTLVLIADDLHELDPNSIAWLASLGRQGRRRKLLIIGTLQAEHASLPAADGLRRHATQLSLGPLGPLEIEAMLRSVFGDVHLLQRLADLIYQRCEGNPGQALDLLGHLVQQHLVHYADGAWILPTEISLDQLPANPNDVLVARIERLEETARSLGRALSVREGVVPLEACAALGELKVADTIPALEALVRAGVLVGSPQGYRFTREPVRTALLAELDEARKRRAHRVAGELLLSPEAASPLERLEGGLHLLVAGDIERGSHVVATAGRHYGLVELAEVGRAAPGLERGLALFLALGRPKHELLSLYAPLALAGYYAERKYADRYAEQTLELLQDLLGLKNARRYRRMLGAKLGLFVALGRAAWAFFRQQKNPRVPSFREAMMLLFYCVAALTGVCAVCIDPKRARRVADVLEPLRALGKDHVATLMHDFSTNLAITVEDRIALARARWQSMIERLDDPRAIRGLPPDVRTLYLAGALYASGVIETWRDSSRALQHAQRLEDFKLKLYELSAHQIRMMYYAHQGDTASCQKYRERVEVHAIQRGTAWQAETWAFGAMVGVYVRTRDAIGVKHCAQRLKQLSAEVPSLERVARSARAAYLILRGSPAEAIPLFQVEEPLAVAGWTRGRGALASAYNLLGQHQAAKDVCEAALCHLSSADFDYPAMNLNVEVELAFAEAGLGQMSEAAARIEGLLKRHAPAEGPLTLSALHEARMQLAAMMHDWSGVEHHLACMQRWQRATGDLSFIARGERSARNARATAASVEHREGEPAWHDAGETIQPLTVVHRLRHGGERTLAGSAEWIIDQLVEYADIRAGHVFLWDDARLLCVSSRGEIPEPHVFESWLTDRLDRDDGLEDVTIRHAGTAPIADLDSFTVNDQSYRLLRLVTSQSAGAKLMGALVLSEETMFEIPARVLRVIAERLRTSLTA